MGKRALDTPRQLLAAAAATAKGTHAATSPSTKGPAVKAARTTHCQVGPASLAGSTKPTNSPDSAAEPHSSCRNAAATAAATANTIMLHTPSPHLAKTCVNTPTSMPLLTVPCTITQSSAPCVQSPAAQAKFTGAAHSAAGAAEPLFSTQQTGPALVSSVKSGRALHALSLAEQTTKSPQQPSGCNNVLNSAGEVGHLARATKLRKPFLTPRKAMLTEHVSNSGDNAHTPASLGTGKQGVGAKGPMSSGRQGLGAARQAVLGSTQQPTFTGVHATSTNHMTAGPGRTPHAGGKLQHRPTSGHSSARALRQSLPARTQKQAGSTTAAVCSTVQRTSAVPNAAPHAGTAAKNATTQTLAPPAANAGADNALTHTAVSKSTNGIAVKPTSTRRSCTAGSHTRVEHQANPQGITPAAAVASSMPLSSTPAASTTTSGPVSSTPTAAAVPVTLLSNTPPAVEQQRRQLDSTPADGAGASNAPALFVHEPSHVQAQNDLTVTTPVTDTASMNGVVPSLATRDIEQGVHEAAMLNAEQSSAEGRATIQLAARLSAMPELGFAGEGKLQSLEAAAGAVLKLPTAFSILRRVPPTAAGPYQGPPLQALLATDLVQQMVVHLRPTLSNEYADINSTVEKVDALAIAALGRRLLVTWNGTMATWLKASSSCNNAGPAQDDEPMAKQPDLVLLADGSATRPPSNATSSQPVDAKGCREAALLQQVQAWFESDLAVPPSVCAG